MTKSTSPSKGRLLESDNEIAGVVRRIRTVAVLGIKTEAQADQPAFYVPQYAQSVGLRIFPVPVYYPEATTILGQPVVRSVAKIGEHIDLVDVFRRPSDLMPHLPDLIEAKPDVVWLQLGIRHADFARALCDAGIDVIQDRCLMVELRQHRSS
ncbi:MAG: CoA-binding protein [Polyangiaceae bacterium]|nr:CoA-binding protein [Polyangiaceae bacterium]